MSVTLTMKKIVCFKIENLNHWLLNSESLEKIRKTDRKSIFSRLFHTKYIIHL